MRRLPQILVVVAAAGAFGVSSVAADPGESNPNTQTRTLVCDNGRTVDATFAGFQGVNFNVTIDESVFVYKTITFVFTSGETEVDDRGIQGFDPASLTTCRYTSPSGSQVTVTGFFTPRG
jgi:hypothetical protein